MTDHTDTIDPQDEENARWLFSGPCEFMVGAKSIEQIPDSLHLPEIAFCGKSNVGKSSLINSILGQQKLVRTSNTPGHTRQVNFFNLRDQLMLVDLPGYGYAKASKGDIIQWNRLIHDYLKGRPNLKRVCVLIDARRTVKEADLEIMKILDDSAVSYQIILTKIDQVEKRTINDIIATVKEQTQTTIARHPTILTTSSKDKTSLVALKIELSQLT